MKALTANFNTVSPDSVKTENSRKLTKARTAGAAWIFILLALGIIVRVFHFLDNRSLWIDEIYLASSLIKMSYGELLAPYLDYEQKAPIGFLWLVRSCVLLFGKGEMALRLISLLSGIGALFLFLPVARYFLKPLGVIVALGILALAPPLVYHAVEIKQYGFELFCTILTLSLYIRYHSKSNLVSALLWGLWGAVIIWFSYTSIFILAGIAMGSALYYLIKKDWPTLFRSLIPFTLWLVSFALNYFLFTYEHAGSEWLQIWFRTYAGFMPFPPTSATDLGWFVQKLFSTLHYPLGLSWFNLSIEHNALLRILVRMALLPVLFLGIGLYWYGKHDKKVLLLFVLPVGLHLLASGLELYPFFDRLTVYLAPVLILIIARGCEQAVALLPKKQPFWAYVLPALLLLGPFINSAQQVINPALFGGYKKSYQREGLLYINQHYQAGDLVYVYWNNRPTYNFYKDAYNLRYNAIIGNDVRAVSNNYTEYFNNLRPELAVLTGKKRVWVTYNKFAMNAIGDIEGQPTWYFSDKASTLQVIQQTFGSMGKKLNSFDSRDMQVNLYDMSGR